MYPGLWSFPYGEGFTLWSVVAKDELYYLVANTKGTFIVIYLFIFSNRFVLNRVLLVSGTSCRNHTPSPLQNTVYTLCTQTPSQIMTQCFVASSSTQIFWKVGGNWKTHINKGNNAWITTTNRAQDLIRELWGSSATTCEK